EDWPTRFAMRYGGLARFVSAATSLPLATARRTIGPLESLYHTKYSQRPAVDLLAIRYGGSARLLSAATKLLLIVDRRVTTLAKPAPLPTMNWSPVVPA